jgi:prevent-host-death family protein
MSTTIPQRELRNNNAAVIAAVVAGETFVVTRNGQPVAEIHPVAPPRRRFVPRSEVLAVAATGPRLDAARFRRDLDAAFDQGL